jgi:acyl-CoA synthetase (AMP-forming)/AMP-acid ligase II
MATVAGEPTDPVIQGSEDSLTIGRILEHGVRRSQGQEIVYAGRNRFTYQEFGNRVVRLAAALAGLGVKRGDVVGVMDWDSHRYLECFFAIPMMGAVLHTINVRLSPEQILYTINHAEDTILLVNSEFAPLLERIWDRVDAGKRLVLIQEELGAHALDVEGEYEALLAAANSNYQFPPLPEHTRATTFYTTGTTGLPKGVYFSHRQIVLHTIATCATLAGTGHGRFSSDDVYLPLTPLFHVHAWGLPYVATMLGVKQIYPGRYEPARLLLLAVAERVTFSHCVPTLLRMLLDCAAAHEISLRGWKILIGGAALSRTLALRAMQQGVDVCCGYGMSETGPILTTSHIEPPMEKWDMERQVEIRCKAGRPLPLVDLRIVDEDMTDLPHDGISQGEIVVRAPWLTAGYLKDVAASAALWRGGWLHTGDIAVIEPDGYVKITDRLKDVIKSGGEWISSLDLEDLLHRHPSVAEVAVIGVPDPVWTERPLAIVVVKSGHCIQSDDLKAHLSKFVDDGLLSKFGIPNRIAFVDAIPKTSVGKLDKKCLREQYGG